MNKRCAWGKWPYWGLAHVQSFWQWCKHRTAICSRLLPSSGTEQLQWRSLEISSYQFALITDQNSIQFNLSAPNILGAWQAGQVTPSWIEWQAGFCLRLLSMSCILWGIYLPWRSTRILNYPSTHIWLTIYEFLRLYWLVCIFVQGNFWWETAQFWATKTVQNFCACCALISSCLGNLESGHAWHWGKISNHIEVQCLT